MFGKEQAYSFFFLNVCSSDFQGSCLLFLNDECILQQQSQINYINTKMCGIHKQMS